MLLYCLNPRRSGDKPENFSEEGPMLPKEIDWRRRKKVSAIDLIRQRAVLWTWRGVNHLFARKAVPEELDKFYLSYNATVDGSLGKKRKDRGWNWKTCPFLVSRTFFRPSSPRVRFSMGFCYNSEKWRGTYLLMEADWKWTMITFIILNISILIKHRSFCH